MNFLNDEVVKSYRDNTIGNGCVIKTFNGEKPLIYADWAASGRLYRPIEERICNEIGKFYGNTHSDDSYIGKYINSVYESARKTILYECKASEEYELLTGGANATFSLHRFQEILSIDKVNKVVVFISGYEHNSNYLTWISLGAEVIIIRPDKNGDIDLDFLDNTLKEYGAYDLIIGSFTACSNVTGITTNYIEAIKVIKRHSGIGIVDFSAIVSHKSLDFTDGVVDAAYWGSHKLLGGPGGAGVLVFKKELYRRKTPTIPSGGTVLWADPKKRALYYDEIYKREDPGTPAILQTVRAEMAHRLISEMGSELMHFREAYFMKYLINTLSANPHIHVFALNNKNRMPIISFTVDDITYDAVTKSLSDFYGIQSRGGCSCAAVYAHELLNISEHYSNILHNQIKKGNCHNKPGWVRISLHATMKKEEIEYISNAINEIADNRGYFSNQYRWDVIA